MSHGNAIAEALQRVRSARMNALSHETSARFARERRHWGTAAEHDRQAMAFRHELELAEAALREAKDVGLAAESAPHLPPPAHGAQGDPAPGQYVPHETRAAVEPPCSRTP